MDPQRATLRLAYDEVPVLAPVVASLLSSGRRVVLDLRPPPAPDLPTVAALARLALQARRSSGALVVRGAADLSSLLRLIGLADLLGDSGQADGQPELREDLRPEEVVEMGDAPG